MTTGLIKKPIFSRVDERGRFQELLNWGTWSSLITGRMKKGSQMGHHYHHHTYLFFHLLSGSVQIKTLNLQTNRKKSLILRQHQSYLFKPEEVRIITYLQSSQFIILKSHAFDAENPDLITYSQEV